MPHAEPKKKVKTQSIPAELVSPWNVAGDESQKKDIVKHALVQMMGGNDLRFCIIILVFCPRSRSFIYREGWLDFLSCEAVVPGASI
jgi:hypothetical protein